MKMIQYVTYLFFIVLLGVTGCSETQTPNATKHAWDEELFFGVIPIESEKRTYERYARFIAYLEQKLGSKITLVVPTDYAGVIDGLAQKKLDFALFGPKSYIEATKQANATTSARVIGEDGQDGYKGVIITKKGSGLKTLADLQGKIWAFTDPNSTSGNLIPSVYFAADAQIHPKTYFSHVIFSGSHEKSILMVKNGDIDAAATNNVDIERDSDRKWHKNDFNIIWESQLIPHDMIAYNKDAPEDFVQVLTQAVLAYKDPQGLKDMAISAFIPAKDEDYVFIRELMDFKEKLQQSTTE